jgi:hypothetical protein
MDTPGFSDLKLPEEAAKVRHLWEVVSVSRFKAEAVSHTRRASRPRPSCTNIFRSVW